MDRIQEAIERAREQRTGKIGQIPVPPVTPAASEPAPSSEPVVLFTEASLPREQDVRAVAAHDEIVERYFREQATPEPALASQEPAPSAGAAPAGAPVGIRYSRTRHVTLDEDRLKENRVIAGLDYDERVEAYRQLRTQVLKILKDNGWNTLAITSPGENAGKSLTATNLAISLSREVNHTVMLVDLDLRQPSLHEMFDVKVEKGVVDYLNGQASLEEVLINPGFQRLVLLPGRALGKYSSEILSSPQMKTLVRDICGRYQDRIIIFDLPPLLRNDDALLFTPTVQATLMVVEDGKTTVNDVQRSLQLLEGSNLIGTILNKARG